MDSTMSIAATNAGECGSSMFSRAAGLFSVRRWQGRLLLFLLLLGPAWLIDRPLAERSPRKYKIGFVEDFRDAARQFGEPFCVFWLALAIWLIDPSRRRPI